MQGCLA